MAVAATPTCSASAHITPGGGEVWRPPTGARQFRPPLIWAVSPRRAPEILTPAEAVIRLAELIPPVDTRLAAVTVPLVDVSPPVAVIRLVALIVPFETMVAPVTVDVEERPPFAEIRPLAVMVPVDTTPVINFMLFCVSWSKPPIFPPLLFRHIR